MSNCAEQLICAIKNHNR